MVPDHGRLGRAATLSQELSPSRRKGAGASMRNLYGDPEGLDRTNSRAAKQASYALQLSEQIAERTEAARTFQDMKQHAIRQPPSTRGAVNDPAKEVLLSPNRRHAFPTHHHHNHRLDLGLLADPEGPNDNHGHEQIGARQRHEAHVLKGERERALGLGVGMGVGAPVLLPAVLSAQGAAPASSRAAPQRREDAFEDQDVRAGPAYAEERLDGPPSPPRSPTKARLRLLADIYGSGIGGAGGGGGGVGGGAGNGGGEEWRPSAAPKSDRQRAQMADQKALLLEQMAEGRARREADKERERRADQEDERRVRAELAGGTGRRPGGGGAAGFGGADGSVLQRQSEQEALRRRGQRQQPEATGPSPETHRRGALELHTARGPARDAAPSPSPDSLSDPTRGLQLLQASLAVLQANGARLSEQMAQQPRAVYAGEGLLQTRSHFTGKPLGSPGQLDCRTNLNPSASPSPPLPARSHAAASALPDLNPFAAHYADLHPPLQQGQRPASQSLR